jgi:hypothetical protein
MKKLYINAEDLHLQIIKSKINILKKICCWLLYFLFFTCQLALSQTEYEYTPFPDSNAIWSEVCRAPVSENYELDYHVLALFNEDTVINSIEYHKLFRLYDTVLNRKKAEYIGGIREDSLQRVYYKGLNLYKDYLYMNTNENGEVLLYDFSLQVGDSLYGGNFMLSYEYLVVEDIDTVTICGEYRKRFHFQYSWQKWIEGIGNINGLLFVSGTIPTNGVKNTLICFKKQGICEYSSPEYESCYPGPLVGINEPSSKSGVEIYPNPAGELLHFRTRKTYSMLCIYDLQGKKQKAINIPKEKNFSIRVSAFPPGLYFYRLTGASGYADTGKFIVK